MKWVLMLFALLYGAGEWHFYLKDQPLEVGICGMLAAIHILLAVLCMENRKNRKKVPVQ